MVGLSTGLALVLGFLKGNEVQSLDVYAGIVPDHADGITYLERVRSKLGSDEVIASLQDQLEEDGGGWRPRFWLRSRVRAVSSSVDGLKGRIHMRFTHHSEVGQIQQIRAFEAITHDVIAPIRNEYVDQWAAEMENEFEDVDNRIRSRELQEENPSAELVALGERWMLLAMTLGRIRDDSVGGLRGISAAPGVSGKAWWKSVPPWAILIAKCTGYGLLAVIPGMFLCEALFPRRELAGDDEVAETPPTP
ncbi:hypothetical protein HAHE_08430 [Haloferula helveola]|uniref:Uncharacterized protein n=2 Tax=Haloferula helveola TaxID=490095 RepID=A0ABN6H0C3_9BACT|nr:hypothetical protein HAHE_08430 [Haloferula helveola]